MKMLENMTYAKKIQWRIRILYCLIAVMLIYMIVVSEAGGGDSRIMTDFANMVSDIIFFGGIIYMIYRISMNKKLLKNRILLKEQMRIKQDERNQYLHDKSGGTVIDILLICLMFITVTTALFDVSAFYTAVTILILTIIFKITAYYFFCHK